MKSRDTEMYPRAMVEKQLEFSAGCSGKGRKRDQWKSREVVSRSGAVILSL